MVTLISRDDRQVGWSCVEVGNIWCRICLLDDGDAVTVHVDVEMSHGRPKAIHGNICVCP